MPACMLACDSRTRHDDDDDDQRGASEGGAFAGPA